MLERRTFLVKERVAMLKLTDRYDIFDPETGEELGFAREELPTWQKVLRLLVAKQLLGSRIVLYQTDEETPLLTILKKPRMFTTRVEILDQAGNSLGSLRTKFFSFRLGGQFDVFDAESQQIATVKGDWKGWTFRMFDLQDRELGQVTKKWAGAMKELFTSADNYVISLSDAIPANAGVAALILAAGLAVDMIFKEHQ